MDLHITLGARGEHATRIYRQLLDAISDGRLSTGARLPPTRALADQLAVSRTTVALAYERLTAEGYLKGRVGAGTYVLPTGRRGGDPTVDEGAGPRPRAIWDTLPLSDTTVEPGVR